MLDARYRREADGAGREAQALAHGRPEPLDVTRVLADQPIFEVVDRCCHGQIGPDTERLSPADDTLVGSRLDEDDIAPAAVDHVADYVGDAHCFVSCFIGTSRPPAR